eukprot:TRINITY_DN416_c0_g1_i1.p1 TRINITY_DN416_c0_g1~~TRINITY_DN416_c0_g1_i1.p1  ORF type:complete len:499 (+),score=142.42 TRINITY_DN416_c0_g1_i1:370-1866(+)
MEVISAPPPSSVSAPALSMEEKTEKGVQALLQWCRRTLHPYLQFQNMNTKHEPGQLKLEEINNFGECWRNGLAFVALLHRHRLLYDYTFITLTKRTPKENVELALETARSALGIDVSYIEADEHILQPKHVDESRVIRFVLGIYHKTQAHKQFEAKGANLVELRKELTKLQEQNERLRFESQFAKEQLEESEKETKFVRKELKTERDMRMSLERKRVSGSDETELTIKELQKRLETEVSERNRFKKQLAEEMVKNSDLEHRLVQFEKQNGGLGVMASKRLSMDARLAPSTIEVMHLRNDLEEKERKLNVELEASNELKRLLKAKETEIDRLHKHLLVTKKSSQDLKRQLSANLDVVASLEKEKKKLERNTSDSSSISQAKLEERLAEAERQKKRLETTIDGLKEELLQNVETKEKLDRTVTGLEVKVKRLTSKLEEEEKQKEALEKQVKSLKSQIESLQKTNNEQSKKLTEYERRLSPKFTKKLRDSVTKSSSSDDKH